MKYKTTKKHPLYKKGIKVENNKAYVAILKQKNISSKATLEVFKDSLEKGWIKEVKQKNYIIDTEDNWKLKKADRNNGEEQFFKSKKEALNYVLDEAKDKLYFYNDYYHFITSYLGEKFLYNSGCEIWRSDNGWSISPVKYPKTNEELMKFAPEEHYCIGPDGVCSITNKSWYKDSDALPTKELAKQLQAFTQLLKWREIYRKIEGWKEDTGGKFCIDNREESGFNVIHYYCYIHTFSFKEEETAQEFLNNFRDLIEQAGDLI